MAAISTDSEPLNKALREFKYEGRQGWGAIFGRLILGWLDRNAPTSLAYTHIVANPSYQQRKPYAHVERILAYASVEDIHRRWPLFPYALKKPVETPKSAGQARRAKLDAAKEHADALTIAGAPDSGPPLRGARILIVDDIFTTGAQLDAVGRRFIKSGAVRVDGLVLARRPWNP